MDQGEGFDGLHRTFDEAEWAWLKPHAERGALILVSNRLDLFDAAEKVAEDDAAVVEGWMQQGLIAKPTAEQIEAWDQDPGKRFLSLVVQPYVLAQEARLH